MCSLFTFRSSPEEARNLFNYRELPNFPPREHVHLTEPIAIVRAPHDGAAEVALVRCGFVPSWAKEPRSQPLVSPRDDTAYALA